jgi:hypothetical protein
VTDTEQELRETKAKIRDDFMRRLFAVAVSVGFATTFSKMEWVIQARIPNTQEWAQLAVLGVAFLATIQSWDGYLVSIQAKKLYNSWRFTIDIVLVLIYMFLLINSNHYYILPPVMALVFLFYFLWDFLTIREHYTQYNKCADRNDASFKEALSVYLKGAMDTTDIYKGPIITLSWLVYFWMFAGIVLLNKPKNVIFICFFELVGLYCYRWDKSVKFSMISRLALIVLCDFLAWHGSYFFDI